MTVGSSDPQRKSPVLSPILSPCFILPSPQCTGTSLLAQASVFHSGCSLWWKIQLSSHHADWPANSFFRWMTPSSFPYVHGAESSISTDFNHFRFHLFTCLSPAQSWEGRHVPNIFLSLVLDIELAHATNSWMFVEWITELQLERVPPEHWLCTR